jgi:hypothetical protein
VSVKMELCPIYASADWTLLNGRRFFHFCPFNAFVQS